MILDSFDSAEEDFRQRQVIEARNEAGTIMAALEKGKKSPAWGQLTSDGKEAHRQAGKALNEVKGEDDYPGDPQRHRRPEPGHHAAGELMMDSAVSTALKGKTMDEADMGEGPDAPHPVAKAEFE